MAKKRRRRTQKDQAIQRNVLISSFFPRVSVSVRGANEPEPEIDGRPRLELRGYMPEPIRDVHEVVLKLWADPHWRVGTVRPAVVAHIVGIRPSVDVICSLPPTEFTYVWSMALSGNLTHVYMSFTKPHYGSADVTYLSFSNELEQ